MYKNDNKEKLRLLYLYFCLLQLGIAALLSSIYAVLQMLVIVGIARQMVEDGVCSPSAIFFMFIGGTFILAALIHPQEFSTLFHGFLYFLLIPCMYLILIIYSLCNLHVISWGTRENKPVKTAAQIEAEKQKEQQQEALAVAKTADGENFYFCAFIYFRFYIAFNTVQVIL